MNGSSSTLHSVSQARLATLVKTEKRDNLLAVGGAKSYDREKAWPSIMYSIFVAIF
jgi:hypothetical protein